MKIIKTLFIMLLLMFCVHGFARAPLTSAQIQAQAEVNYKHWVELATDGQITDPYSSAVVQEGEYAGVNVEELKEQYLSINKLYLTLGDSEIPPANWLDIYTENSKLTRFVTSEEMQGDSKLQLDSELQGVMDLLLRESVTSFKSASMGDIQASLQNLSEQSSDVQSFFLDNNRAIYDNLSANLLKSDNFSDLDTRYDAIKSAFGSFDDPDSHITLFEQSFAKKINKQLTNLKAIKEKTDEQESSIRSLEKLLNQGDLKSALRNVTISDALDRLAKNKDAIVELMEQNKFPQLAISDYVEQALILITNGAGSQLALDNLPIQAKEYISSRIADNLEMLHKKDISQNIDIASLPEVLQKQLAANDSIAIPDKILPLVNTELTEKRKELQQLQQELMTISDDAAKAKQEKQIKKINDRVSILEQAVNDNSLTPNTMEAFVVQYLKTDVDLTSLSIPELQQFISAVKASTISNGDKDANIMRLYNTLITKSPDGDSTVSREKIQFNEKVMSKLRNPIYVGPDDTVQGTIEAYINTQLTKVYPIDEFKKESLSGLYTGSIKKLRDLVSEHESDSFADNLNIPSESQVSAYLKFSEALQEIPTAQREDRDRLALNITAFSDEQQIERSTNKVVVYKTLQEEIALLSELSLTSPEASAFLSKMNSALNSVVTANQKQLEALEAQYYSPEIKDYLSQYKHVETLRWDIKLEESKLNTIRQGGGYDYVDEATLRATLEQKYADLLTQSTNLYNNDLSHFPKDVRTAMHAGIREDLLTSLNANSETLNDNENYTLASVSLLTTMLLQGQLTSDDVASLPENIRATFIDYVKDKVQKLPDSTVDSASNPNKEATETYNELVQKFRDNAELYLLNPEEYATRLEGIITSFNDTATTLQSTILDTGRFLRHLRKSKPNAAVMDTAVNELEQNPQFRQLMLDNFQSDAAADDLSEANAEQLQTQALAMLNSEGFDYLDKTQLEQYADIFSQLGDKMTENSPRTDFTIQLGKVLGVEAIDTTMQTLFGNQLKDWANTKTNDLVVSAYRASMGDDVADVVAAVHDAQDALHINTRNLSDTQVNDLEGLLDSVIDPVRLDTISAVDNGIADLLTHVTNIQAHAANESSWFNRLYEALTGKTQNLLNNLSDVLEERVIQPRTAIVAPASKAIIRDGGDPHDQDVVVTVYSRDSQTVVNPTEYPGPTMEPGRETGRGDDRSTRTDDHERSHDDRGGDGGGDGGGGEG